MLKFKFYVVLSAALLICSAALVHADEPYCEVVSAYGSIQLESKKTSSQSVSQGMQLQQGDRLELNPGAYMDLAFDREWNNTTRLNGNTIAVLTDLDPVKINMLKGDAYAKLDKLPQGSKFEIQTPIALAAARGTQYRVTHENGNTTVYNDSEVSLVYVYRLDSNGNRAGRAIVLKPGESVTLDGEAEVYSSLLDSLEEDRDREDQDNLNDDLERTRTDQPESKPRGGEILT